MENSKKITVYWSDISPFVNKSSKVYPKIGICKNEKIDFFAIKCKYIPTFSTCVIGKNIPLDQLNWCDYYLR